MHFGVKLLPVLFLFSFFVNVSEALDGSMFDPEGGSGFVRRKSKEGKALYWRNRRIAMEINYLSAPAGISEELLREIVGDAQSKWEKPGCTDIDFEEPATAPSSETNLSDDYFRRTKCGDRFNIPTNETDCINRIVFRTSTDPSDLYYWPQDKNEDLWTSNAERGASEEEADPRDVLALTTTFFVPKTGQIIDADMDINASNFDWVSDDGVMSEDDVAELSSVVTHELGHVLGFGHMPGETSSIMYWQRIPGVNDLNEANDREAVCTTYPFKDITPGVGKYTVAGIDGGCSIHNTDSCSVAVFVVALLLWTRRKGYFFLGR
ncbi:MAG: matrixin family metalloprotease [Myxococcales bacterium]|nr:MAG: matrixin family metalloprotease [Myxococcales bacterium]